MECRWWIVVAIVIYTSAQGTFVFCQNVATGNVARESRDCSRSSGNPTSADLFNSILTAAASNGVLPDLLPMLQGQSIADNLQRSPYGQDVLTKPLSVIPMPPGYGTQEHIVYSSQALLPSTTSQNVIITPLPYGSSCQPNAVPAVSQTFSSPALPNCMPQIAQSVSLENYPVCAQNAGTSKPMPIVLQPQCQFNDVNPYNIYNQVLEPRPLPDLNTQTINLPIMPPPQVLPSINTCSGILEVAPNLAPNQNYQTKPTVLTTDGQQLPLNLQINVPTPNVPAPKITVVSATPSNAPVSSPASYCPDYPTTVQPFQYPPQAPIVIGGSSRSSLRDLLPILLVTMFSDRGCGSGGGCRCCCNCCNSGNSGNNIPIPYPIPIPTNNPIVNTCSYPSSSRRREYRDDGDEDEDRR